MTIKRKPRDPRVASILESALAVDARMDADDPPADPPKDTPPKDDPKPPHGGKGADDKGKSSSDADPDDDVDKIKSDARKSDNRAKQARAALEAAEQEKKAADEAREAAEAKNTEMLDAIGKALGLKSDDTPPDPAKLEQALNERDRDLKAKDDALSAKDEEIAKREAVIAAKDVELAAWRVAVKEGVNAGMWLDLRSTEKALAALDPTADDLDTKLAELAKAAVKDNASLRATREASAGDAGIGAVGGRDDTAVKPGTGRLRQAYTPA